MQAKEIKKLRDSLGLTQEKFARLLNVTTTSINRWENGVAKPSSMAMEKIEAVKERGKDGKGQ
jgi:DNA-binding transcriptional regulator YiaG